MRPQVKVAYVNFVNHCYVDTEVEMKEIYTSNHIWKLFEDFTVDMARVSGGAAFPRADTLSLSLSCVSDGRFFLCRCVTNERSDCLIPSWRNTSSTWCLTPSTPSSARRSLRTARLCRSGP